LFERLPLEQTEHNTSIMKAKSLEVTLNSNERSQKINHALGS